MVFDTGKGEMYRDAKNPDGFVCLRQDSFSFSTVGTVAPEDIFSVWEFSFTGNDGNTGNEYLDER